MLSWFVKKDIHLMKKFAFECDHFMNSQCLICFSISNNYGQFVYRTTYVVDKLVCYKPCHKPNINCKATEIKGWSTFSSLFQIYTVFLLHSNFRWLVVCFLVRINSTSNTSIFLQWLIVRLRCGKLQGTDKRILWRASV